MVQKLFKAVQALWKELFGLRQLHQKAVLLLQGLVVHRYQVGIPSHHESLTGIMVVYPPIITLLAARATELCFDQGLVQLTKMPLLLLAECGMFKETNYLRSIDASNVDMGYETLLLENLLPCCLHLTVLKLDCNVTPTMLYAAKQCPLQVLHVSERMLSCPRLSLEVLSEVVLGVPGHNLKAILDTHIRGEQVTFRPSWPNLFNFSTGWCTVSLEFFILVLIVLGKMEYLGSNVVPISSVVRMYAAMLGKAPGLHQLALKANCITYEDFWELHPHYPKLENVTLMIVNTMEETLMNFFELGHLLPNVKMLRLTHVPALRPSRLPQGDKFQEFRRRIVILELDSIMSAELNACWVFKLLQQFPCLQRLYLNANLIVYTEPVEPRVTVFNTVTEIQCVCNNGNELFLRFLYAFPNLHKLTLTEHEGEISFPWERLTEFRKLRHLHLFACGVRNISDLCKVPRKTSDGSSWELHTSSKLLSLCLMYRLRRAGWNWVPINDEMWFVLAL